jgi:hypothetical protein
MPSLTIKNVPGLGFLYFSLSKNLVEQECEICGRKTIFEVVASNNYFEGTKHKHWPCCQNSCCYNELIARREQETYQVELAIVFSEKKEGEYNAGLS